MNNHATQILNILFVDDDADELYLFNEALEQSAITVNVMRAKDGQQVIEMLNTQNHPDIIFLDLNMPYKDGMETLSEIKNDLKLNHIPIIIFSTSKNPQYISNCYNIGATFYVVKPESFDDITKIVRKVFSISWMPKFPQPSREDFVLEY